MEMLKQVPEDKFAALTSIVTECQKPIVGKRPLIEAILIGFLCEGHILLEGVPGVAKTTLAKTFANVIGLDFKRIQGSSDTLPADLVGTYIYEPTTSSFKLQKGPVFTNVLLIDEINRNSPRTNSAVLEAMQERQVTISGETHALPAPFMTIATQSPIEFQGVFPLPEVLVDRFLLSVDVDYPSTEEEIELTNRIFTESTTKNKPVLKRELLTQLIELTGRVYVAPNVQSYIVDIVQRSRRISGVSLGASPRASIALSKASRANALLRNRAYVTPDDVTQLAPLALRHRIVTSTLVGATPADDLIKSLLEEIPIPQRSE
jgi:MoxR-like ATPase